MRFFCDRNIPPQLARMLDCYDRKHSVVHHDEWFEKTTPDTEWLSDIASRDPIPVVVSGDGRILRNEAELEVLKGLNLTFFVLASGWTNIPWREQAWKAVKIWPEIVSNASPRRPTIFRVPVRAEKIELLSLTSQLGSTRKQK